MKFVLFLVCTIFLSIHTYGQSLIPYDNQEFVKFLSIDKFLNRYYLFVKVADSQSNAPIRSVWLENNELYNILSKRFDNYDSYAVFMKSYILSNKVVRLNVDEMVALNDYFIDTIKPVPFNDKILIDKYFDHGYCLKNNYKQNDKEVKKIL